MKNIQKSQPANVIHAMDVTLNNEMYRRGFFNGMNVIENGYVVPSKEPCPRKVEDDNPDF